MWGTLVQLGIMGLIYGYHRWIEDKPKPKPLGLELPTVEAGAPVPLIYGSCRVRAPILAWAGPVHPVPLDEIGHPDIIDDALGWQYQNDLFFVVGIPFFGGTADSLVIYAGDKPLFVQEWDPPLNAEGEPQFPVPHEWENPTADHYTIHGFPVGQLLANIYGGYGLGGGIGYQLEFWDGDAAQQIADGDGYSFTELRMVAGGTTAALIPGYRRQVCVLLYRWSVGETPSMTPYSFAVRSVTYETIPAMPAWFGQSLPFDADPAAVVYDALTSPWGKLNLPASLIDRESFEAVSLTLFAEEHGYSRSIESHDDAASVIGDVLKQIDGMIFVDPVTGLLVLRLVRFDYDPESARDVNPDNMASPDSAWYSVQGWNETFNQIRVKFTDRSAHYADGLAIGQNQANIVSQGGRIRSTEIRFPGCCTAELARKLASRELAVASRPMVQATVTVDRTFSQTRPGDVVTLTYPDLEIDHMLMRVVSVNTGLLDAGPITMQLIRDVFDVSIGAFPAA